MSEPMSETQQLAALGQAVLDEHRTALLAERALQDPELQAAAAVAQYHARELLHRAYAAQERQA